MRCGGKNMAVNPGVEERLEKARQAFHEHMLRLAETPTNPATGEPEPKWKPVFEHLGYTYEQQPDNSFKITTPYGSGHQLREYYEGLAKKIADQHGVEARVDVRKATAKGERNTVILKFFEKSQKALPPSPKPTAPSPRK